MQYYNLRKEFEVVFLLVEQAYLGKVIAFLSVLDKYSHFYLSIRFVYFYHLGKVGLHKSSKPK